MAEARQQDQWNHTSLVLAVLANIHRDPKKSGRYTADDFNPFTKRKSVAMKAGIDILKQVFVDRPTGDAK